MSYTYRILPKKSLFNLNLTFLLIIINLAVFIISMIATAIKPEFLSYTALSPANIFNGFYFWTFLTSMFMHSGFFHLFANMISLMFIGSLVERIIGKKRFFLFYLISGLFAGVFFVLTSLIPIQFFSGDFNAYAVGASGAIFGLAGLLMILTPNLPVYMMFIPIPIKMKYAVPAMLALLWFISALGNVPIGNVAHLGGFVAGLAYGIHLRRKYKNKTKYIQKVFS